MHPPGIRMDFEPICGRLTEGFYDTALNEGYCPISVLLGNYFTCRFYWAIQAEMRFCS